MIDGSSFHQPLGKNQKSYGSRRSEFDSHLGRMYALTTMHIQGVETWQVDFFSSQSLDFREWILHTEVFASVESGSWAKTRGDRRGTCPGRCVVLCSILNLPE